MGSSNYSSVSVSAVDPNESHESDSSGDATMHSGDKRVNGLADKAMALGKVAVQEAIKFWPLWTWEQTNANSNSLLVQCHAWRQDVAHCCRAKIK